MLTTMTKRRLHMVDCQNREAVINIQAGISVSELCKLAGINRGTFYLHYCDLRAALEEQEEETLREELSNEP